jgi:hypothetical protein
MKLETIELRKMTASSGMVLTNGKEFTEVSGSVYLGCYSQPDDWYEITEEEYEKILESKFEGGD